MKKTNETTEGVSAFPDGGALALAEAPDAKPAAKAARKPRGRPLSFDRDAALETAMHVFWERGYEAASIADLTSAMGITPPSLYTAFGDKEQLFLEAIERYALGYGSAGARALEEEPNARSAIERWLTEAANELTQPCHPKGCMVVMAATNCSAAAERVQDALLLRRTEAIANVGRRIQGGIDNGELPPDTDAKDLANFYATIYQGMSMQAKDGATHESLMATVRTAMRSWPRM
ncbi:TetR/AcrR family transcriptional regulator [Scleromatobacter humisilvae]|uniref:TetR/AcrR family transcriptional regulator n=1 Tax=Scleromatobacter humisilvae TaxID=2897159 RepID=A0A9X2BYP0_9BURK|nr:TetR/AcrR family transcriptional regulator [Scleromatobacter humisilvae]MCK9685547.1 TetR/AcrR family transcriptional regulator [Scleromatobacter humisilvae]